MISKTLSLLLCSTVVAAAAGATAARLLGPAQPLAAESGSTSAALERLSAELARVAARQDALEGELARGAAGAALVAPSGTRVAQADIEAAVERWMRANAPDPGAVPARAGEAPAAASTADRVAAALERLGDGGLSDTERQALWRSYASEGLLDELVAAYEARAEAAPHDPDAQVELASAYLNKIFEVGNGPEAGLWATKADRAFDRALEIDDTHWQARFGKAVSLSFWPPVFGKQGEAIRQFEILAEQQSRLPADERYAQTYLLLGNMYRQIGEEEQAAAAWRRGLETYPGNPDLLGQLEVFSVGD